MESALQMHLRGTKCSLKARARGNAFFLVDVPGPDSRQTGDSTDVSHLWKHQAIRKPHTNIPETLWQLGRLQLRPADCLDGAFWWHKAKLVYECAAQSPLVCYQRLPFLVKLPRIWATQASDLFYGEQSASHLRGCGWLLDGS